MLRYNRKLKTIELLLRRHLLGFVDVRSFNNNRRMLVNRHIIQASNQRAHQRTSERINRQRTNELAQKRTSPAGYTPLFGGNGLNGYLLLDRVWFSGSCVLNRVYNFTFSRLEQVSF